MKSGLNGLGLMVAVAFFCQTSDLWAAIIDPNELVLMATVQTRGEYDNNGLGTWNGAPLSSTNQPTYADDQLSAALKFYVNPAASNDLFVSVTNVYDTQYGYLFGPPFDYVALTGFDFSLPVKHGGTSATFSNQWALPNEVLLGPTAGASAPLTETPGWGLMSVSGTNKEADYSVGTLETDDALTHFSTVSGETRINGGAIFEFDFKNNVDLFTDAQFGLLSADTYYGLGMYEGTGELTYLNQGDPAPIPEPAALPLFATGLGALGLLHWHRRRKAQAVAA